MGDAISPGVVRGAAKVLTTPYEKPLLAGEILVTRATEPSWTPIFINAAGVVMEIGGPLQHGAIIAREYGIPCVSGLEGATTQVWKLKKAINQSSFLSDSTSTDQETNENEADKKSRLSRINKY